ncbi:S1C family serine protease [Lacisediminimonas profundi]|uniref:S1C family serine protease n=1 Tax=Lacisediminimonas profundi TaxID=2603856 RepID=UPI00124BBF55|nr:trypsin-like peptidase domain-containing protein [Lacisediminimonas profundi]
MNKVGLYSRSPKSRRQPDRDGELAAELEGGTGSPAKERTQRIEPPASGATRSTHEDDPLPAASSRPAAARSRLRAACARHERMLLFLGCVLFSLAAFAAWQHWMTAPVRQLTQKEIDRAVLHALDKNVLPAQEAKAFEAIRRSVVRVRQFGNKAGNGDEPLTGIGTGVVIVEQGTILTNLHVVAGAQRVQVIFHDGSVSDATVISRQPENDLAVLQARSLPDDLAPATLRSTGDLVPGDRVIAVGFPFGIGPSVSSGVISGLRRQYSSPDGEKVLSNLIQFDAAANPGNSGGPLVTMDGAVVGIVTAILNPVDQGVFIGIAFAVPIENAAAAAGESPF